MDFLLLRVFPATLMLGGLLLLFVEGRHYWTDGGPKPRYLRRSLGAILLCGLAVMVYLGEIPHPATVNPAELWPHLRHWLYVLLLALGLMALATWDAVDGVRHLRHYFEGVEQEEIAKIQQHLAAGKAGPRPPEEA